MILKISEKMRQSKGARAKGVKFLLVLLALAVFLSFPALSGGPGSRVDANTIADLNKKQESISQNLAKLKKEKEALKSEKSQLEGELAWLNSRTQAEQDKYKLLIDDMNLAYEEMEKSIQKALDAASFLEAKEEEFRDRLRVMFENSKKNSLELILESRNVTELFTNIQLIGIIAENDRRTVEELAAAKDDADLKSTEALLYYEEMQVYTAQKKKEIEDLRDNLAQTGKDLEETNRELTRAEKEEKALQAESAKIEADIKKLQTSAAYYGGTMIWPTPGYTGINPGNGFGMRLHPIYNYERMHSGIDINAPFDSKIVAVAEGKVILVRTIPGYNAVSGNNTGGSGYGNYIIVDHGGGISTLYAHCKLLKVRVGDSVKTGQWIAVTGSTGVSTGAHLHFEVRENGTPVQPLQKKYLGVRR